MSGPLSGWTITGDGVQVHHLEAGSGPAVVLLPGWSLTAQTFSAQLAELSLSRRVVAVDHRGHIAIDFSTPGMARGWADADGTWEIRLGGAAEKAKQPRD